MSIPGNLPGMPGNLLGNLLFPENCAFCNRFSEESVCSRCLSRIIRSDGEKSRFSSLFDLGDVYCFGKYTGILKDAFIEYKFHGKIWLGRKFGEMTAETFAGVLSADRYDFITFVPVSEEGFKNRGFDQCAEIAYAISRKSGIPVREVVGCSSLKTKQSGLTRQNRAVNVHGKFIPKDEKTFELSVRGRKILIVDDILTTGATLRELGLLLKEAGAEITDAMVFATGRTDSDRETG